MLLDLYRLNLLLIKQTINILIQHSVTSELRTFLLLWGLHSAGSSPVMPYHST